MILAEIDAQQLALQQLPTLGVLLIASVFWFGLFAKARKQLAAEVSRQQADAAKPHRVEVQSPLTVEPATTYATASELGDLRRELASLRSEIRSGLEGIRRERSENESSLHEKINATNASLHELSGTMQAMSQQVGLVLNKLLNQPAPRR